MFKRIGFAVILILLAATYAYGAATLFPFPKFTAIDSNGDPLSGGKVYTYTTGTTTAKTTWTDADKGTANANPVILDSNGQANIWLEGQYRIVLKSSADVTQWTVDNVDSIVTVGGQFVYPESYGAVGDGSTDDTTAIQDAIDSLTGGGTVMLRAGTYLVSGASSGNVLELSSGTWLRGVGKSATTIKLAASAADGAYILGTAASAVRCHISDLTIDGNRANQTNGQWGIRLDGADFCVVENVRVTDVRHVGIGIEDGSDDNVIINNEVDSWGPTSGTGGFGIVVWNGSHRNHIGNNVVTGIAVSDIGIACDASTTGGGGTAPTDNQIINNTISVTKYGIAIEDSHRSLVSGNLLYSQTTIAIIVQEGQDTLSPLGNKIVDNTIRDSSALAVGISVNGAFTTIEGNDIRDLYSGSLGIKLASAQAVSDVLIALNTITNFTGSGIVVERGARIKIADNIITSLTTGRAIYVVPASAVNYLDICGNVIEDIDTVAAGYAAIYVLDNGAAATDVQIHSNMIHNVGVSGDQSGIAISGTTQTHARIRVFDNFIRDSQGTSTLTYGINIGGNITDIYTYNNTVYNYKTAPIRTGIATVTDHRETATGTFTLRPDIPTAIDSSGGAVTGTLGDGNFLGQIKTIVMVDSSNSSTISVTNHETSDPEVGTFNAVDEYWTLVWTGTEWATISNSCTFL